MKRWAIAMVASSVAVTGGAVWTAAALRGQLDDARRETRLVDLARAASDQESRHYADELRRTEKQLAEAEGRLERVLADLKAAQRPDDLASRVADARFCFNPYDARFSGWVRGPLVADVDGDGVDDRVYTVGRPTLLGRSCRYLVVAETGSGTYATRITGKPLWLHPSNFQLYLAPVAAAQLDDRAGYEVLVHVTQGASTEGAVLYSLVDGALERLRVQAEPDDVFGYYGSVNHGGVLNCVDGVLVKSSYGQAGNGPRLAITRSFYEVAGTTLALVREERHRRLSWHDFGEFGGRPLSRCEGYVRAPEFPLATNEGPFVTGQWARPGKR